MGCLRKSREAPNWRDKVGLVQFFLADNAANIDILVRFQVQEIPQPFYGRAEGPDERKHAKQIVISWRLFDTHTDDTHIEYDDCFFLFTNFDS